MLLTKLITMKVGTKEGNKMHKLYEPNVELTHESFKMIDFYNLYIQGLGVNDIAAELSISIVTASKWVSVILQSEKTKAKVETLDEMKTPIPDAFGYRFTDLITYID